MIDPASDDENSARKEKFVGSYGLSPTSVPDGLSKKDQEYNAPESTPINELSRSELRIWEMLTEFI